MSINLKEKLANINKKKVSIGLLIFIILVVCGIGAYQYFQNKNKSVSKPEQTYQEEYVQPEQEQTDRPKRPSEYSVGIDYNKAIKGNKPILTLFYADWCGYCVRFMPIFEGLSKKYGKNVTLSKVNVEDPKYQTLVKEVGITGFPTVFIIDPKYDNRVLLSNAVLGSVDSVSVEIDRFMRIRKLLEKSK